MSGNMERDLDPVFLQARDAIESVLSKYGFRVHRESSYPGAFGSAEVQYRHRAHWLQLSWDGKDRYLWLSGAVSRDQHTFPGAAAWHALDPPPSTNRPALFLQPGPLTDARIREMLDQIELFRVSRAAV